MNQRIHFKYIKKLNYILSISYNLNIPFKLKNQIEISAKKNNKSINSEIQYRLENSFTNEIEKFSTDDLKNELKRRDGYSDKISKLKDYLEKIKKEITKEKPLTVFPDKHKILDPQENLILIIKHGNNILKNFEKKSLDFIYEEKLLNIFIKHIYEYLLKENIYIPGIPLGFGQEYFTSKPLYHIAKSKIFHEKYSNIDLLNSGDFELYTVPFILRLCIETKIKSIIGFESLTKCINNNFINDFNIPVKDVLRILSLSKIIDFPVQFNTLMNIYDWSCQFTHNANKENIWITLEALEILDPIFLYTEEKSRHQSVLDENHHFYEYLNYLKPNFELIDLENEINNNQISKRKKYKFKLNKEKLGSKHPIYNKIDNTHI